MLRHERCGLGAILQALLARAGVGAAGVDHHGAQLVAFGHQALIVEHRRGFHLVLSQGDLLIRRAFQQFIEFGLRRGDVRLGGLEVRIVGALDGFVISGQSFGVGDGRVLKRLFPESTIYSEKVLGITKSFVALK